VVLQSREHVHGICLFLCLVSELSVNVGSLNGVFREIKEGAQNRETFILLALRAGRNSFQMVANCVDFILAPYHQDCTSPQTLGSFS
jgi:hypothetical protein